METTELSTRPSENNLRRYVLMLDERTDDFPWVQFYIPQTGTSWTFIDSSEITVLDRTILERLNIHIAPNVLIYNGVALYRNTTVHRYCVLEIACVILPDVELQEGTRVRKGEIRAVKKQSRWNRLKTRIALIGVLRPIKPKRPPSNVVVVWQSFKRLVRSLWPQRRKLRSNSK